MNKKLKRNVLLMTGLAGSLVASSVAGVALSSCTTTSSSSSSDVQYSYVIDWSNPTLVDRLTVDSNGLVYSDSSKTTIIATLPTITLTTVKIPSTVKSITGYAKVVTDANGTKTYQSVGAFQDNTLIQSVVFESGSNLQSIGSLAFSGCTNLQTISGVTNSLTFVGSNAFTNCSNLTTIDLSNVLNVGEYAFQNCSSLVIDNLNSVISIGQYAFSGALDATAKTALNLNNVVSIGNYAFSGSNVFSVDLSTNTSLKTIGQYAFQGCTNLSGTIDLSNCSLVTSIGNYAFADDTGLTAVYIPAENSSNLTTIGQYAFSGCTSLTTVAPNGQTGFVATSKISQIGAYAFANSAIKSIDFSTTSITNSNSALDDSFKNMHYVEAVKVSSSLQQISMTMFNYVGDLGAGFDLVLPSSITNIAVRSSGTAYSGGAMTYAPFANSGLKSIDMSQITGYDTNTTNSDATSVNPGQFWNATKLETVILKTGTTRFWARAFEGCSNLKVVKESDQTYTSGFVAKDTLQTISTNIFTNAITEGQDFPVDLTALSFTTTLTGLSGSNITSLKLPSTVTTISDNSFVNMSKLTSVNFEDLTELTSIGSNNFSSSLLTNIDLSNTKLTSVSSGSFMKLQATAVASFPTTLTGGFTGIFTTTGEGETPSYISFSFPKGINTSFISSYVSSSGVLQNLATASAGAGNVLKNLSSLNLSSNTSVTSVGTNTFFGNSKLTSLTLSGTGITSANIFTVANISAENTSNTATTSSYVVANVPFGNNTSLTSLNYSNFTANATSATATTPETLFNTTTSTTWTEVAKIINSLSYQASPTTAEAAAALKPNLSAWTPVTSGTTTTTAILSDSTATFTAVNGSTPAQVQFNNSFAVNGSESGNITIKATDATTSFVHNGITWTYTNDGTNITLTANNVNMYKATSGNNSYLAFFNELAWKASDTAETTYYVPATQSVNVTLTIATASSNAS